MLDTETKRKIDNCRDVLVGKIPDPKSQVEQITIALIYKFMDDMDQLSVDQGGKPSFFRGEFQKYAWSSIFDRRLGGQEILNLYGEALIKMNQNPNIPQLFRDIFKNAFLPYRDPETLRLFLKEISVFTYDHSEKLGDAFEYLLSVLSSQGDAGQFRTPRHIIDFIVEVVEPQLNETVLDPACGTAGFLISAYKHITRNNPKLSTSQKQRLMTNFVGYDISYDMVRLSLVNMYLHGFPQPHIFEYDTLTSEDRWQDTFDVIMANPPFMTPKGGIRPHSRFSIQAKRSEVLFVDYIAEHLNPGGRAGVIVPEGIIFQSQNAYKALRKMLVENYLWAVVSLPAGIFNPYSGVKTSILLMDKSLAKRIDKILFVKIENDGFDLGAQRRQVDGSDLPAALKFINIYKSKIENYKSKIKDSPLAHAVLKSEIAKSGDYNFSGDRYRQVAPHETIKYPIVTLEEVAEVIAGQSPDGKHYNDRGEGLPFYQGKIEFSKMYIGEPQTWTTQTTKIALKDDILMSVRAPVGPVNFATQKICIGRGLASIRPSKKINKLYLFYYLRSIQDKIKGNGGAVFDSISRTQIGAIKIPLPPLEVQEKIVAEIDGYQKIIDGARQIVENYKPTIKINPAWPMIKIENADFEIIDGDRGVNYPKANEFFDKGDCVFLNTKNVTKGGFNFDNVSFISKEKDAKLNKGKLKRNDVILTTRGTIGNVAIYDETVLYDHIRINSGMLVIRPNTSSFVPKYLYLLFKSQNVIRQFDRILSGSAQPQMPIRNLIDVEIPLPPLDDQKQIVAEIETEQKIVNENKKLIEIFEAKIKGVISEIWGEKQTLQASPKQSPPQNSVKGILFNEVMEPYRFDAQVACLVLEDFLKREKPVREFHLQKFAYITQEYLKMPVVSQFIPMAAGPWSSGFKDYACELARQENWFFLKDRNVIADNALHAGIAAAEKTLSRQKDKIRQLLEDLKHFGDGGLERWATILMVVAQLKTHKKPITRRSIQKGIDDWPEKREKKWFQRSDVNRAIDGMNKKGWLNLVGQ